MVPCAAFCLVWCLVVVRCQLVPVPWSQSSTPLTGRHVGHSSLFTGHYSSTSTDLTYQELVSVPCLCSQRFLLPLHLTGAALQCVDFMDNLKQKNKKKEGEWGHLFLKPVFIEGKVHLYKKLSTYLRYSCTYLTRSKLI